MYVLVAFLIFGGIWAGKDVWLPYMERRQSLIEKESEARMRLEEQREARKARESADRSERDREMARMQGQWLEQYKHSTQVQDRSNTISEGIKDEMRLLRETVNDSKESSRAMGERQIETQRMVGEIHSHVFGGEEE